MSTVGTLTKIATGVIGKTAHAVTHPVATVTTAAGQVHKVATSFTGSDSRSNAADERAEDRAENRAENRAEQRAEAPVEERSAPPIVTPDPTEAAEAAVAAELAREVEAEPAPAEVTEPKAATREAAHGGRGEEPTDDWHDELDDGTEVETAAGTPGVPPEINPATGLPHQAPSE